MIIDNSLIEELELLSQSINRLDKDNTKKTN